MSDAMNVASCGRDAVRVRGAVWVVRGAMRAGPGRRGGRSGAETESGVARTCGELSAGDHRHRLVLSPVVTLVGVGVEHRGPQQRGTAPRLDRDVQPWEVRVPARLDLVEVHEEGVDARPPR